MSETGTPPPLRIAVLGDFDGMHTRRWLEVFVQRGHEVHAISYYPPATGLLGVTLHVLSSVAAPSAASGGGPASAAPRLRRIVPPSGLRLVHAMRYRRAGLKRVLQEIGPDIFHAHYAVEHGFYGAFADFHPYVVSAWGSDLLVESHRPIGRIIAKKALGTADLVTANDASLARRAAELGVPEDRIAVVHLGIDRLFLEAGDRGVNVSGSAAPPVLLSDRALEPLYNVDTIIQAFAGLKASIPAATLLIAGDGSERPRLERMGRDLLPGGGIEFLGRLDPPALAERLAAAHVFVSVPSSDSLALSLVEAMAAGAFPVVSDLPSMDGWIHNGENGLRVPARDASALQQALQRALDDASLRQRAASANRHRAATEGLREANMLLMERHYYRLAGHPMAGAGEGI